VFLVEEVVCFAKEHVVTIVIKGMVLFQRQKYKEEEYLND